MGISVLEDTVNVVIMDLRNVIEDVIELPGAISISLLKDEEIVELVEDGEDLRVPVSKGDLDSYDLDWVVIVRDFNLKHKV